MKNRNALRIVGALVVAQAVLVLAFVLPGYNPAPHDVPVAVAGPVAAVEALERRAGGAFAFTAHPAAAAAERAVIDRDAYGTMMLGRDGRPRALIVASAASPAVAQILEGALGRGVPVRDIRPLDADDPRGTTLGLLFLPLTVLCLPAALLLGRLRLSPGGLLGAVAGFAALGGLVVAALVSVAIGALPGPFLALAGLLALIILAIALPTAGLERAVGPAGVGVAALVFLVFGNPGSGNASAPELLPGLWRVTGQLLPPGAGGDAVRGVAYFEGAGSADAIAVLGAWVLFGVALVLAAEAVARRRRAAAGELTGSSAALAPPTDSARAHSG